MENRKDYKMMEDSQYGYIRCDPIPSPEFLEGFYAGGFYEDPNAFRESAVETQLAQKEFFDWRWQDIHRVFKEYFKDKRGADDQLSVFDIGCGFAFALMYFKNQGFEVSGMEPSLRAVEYAKKNGIDLQVAGVDDIDKVEKKYDAVLVLDVIEHLPDPAKALIDIRTHLLKPDGLLAMHLANDFNPFQEAANEVYDLDQYWFAPPRHINCFTVESIRKLVEKCGYEVEYLETSFPMELFLLMGDVYIGDHSIGSKCHAKRVAFERALRTTGRTEFLHKFYKAMSELGVGREVEIFCRPK